MYVRAHVYTLVLDDELSFSSWSLQLCCLKTSLCTILDTIITFDIRNKLILQGGCIVHLLTRKEIAFCPTIKIKRQSIRCHDLIPSLRRCTNIGSKLHSHQKKTKELHLRSHYVCVWILILIVQSWVHRRNCCNMFFSLILCAIMSK